MYVQPCQRINRFDRKGYSLQPAVCVFHGVELVEFAAHIYQITCESYSMPVDIGDQHRRTSRVTFGRQYIEAIATPREGFVVFKISIHVDIAC